MTTRFWRDWDTTLEPEAKDDLCLAHLLKPATPDRAANPRWPTTLLAFLLFAGTTNVYGAGRVFAWGDNSSGQTAIPSGLGDPVAVASGVYHSLALRSDGTVISWGRNTYGQANVPTSLSNAIAIAAGEYHSLALTADGGAVAWGSYSPANVPAGLSNLTAVACGASHSLALNADGRVFSWGYGSATIVPNTLSNAVAIAGGLSHSLALRRDGTVLTWGTGSSGLTNPPPGLNDVVAIASGYSHNLALRGDGTVVAWGDNSRGQTNLPPGLSNVVVIGAAGYHSLALRNDGTVFAWGWNSDGQLNVPGGLANLVALAGGERHSLALERDGRPQFTAGPFNRLAVVGTPANLLAWAAGNQPMGFQWFFGGAALDTATQATLPIPAVQLSHAGRYWCVASNALGSTTSAPVMLEVTECPVITRAPASRTVFTGDQVELAAAAAGSPPLSYQWLRDGSIITGSTGTTFFLERAHPSSAGGYSVRVSNGCGSVTSAAAILTVSEHLPLLRLTNVWRYNQSGLDLGTAWKETDYSDSAWLQGPGLLGVEDNAAIVPLIRTTLKLTNAARNSVITYYFRTHFMFTNDPSDFYLSMTNFLDDGAVVYLNGQEVYRCNMASAEVQTSMLSLVPVPEPFIVRVNCPAGALVHGDNLLAVEVHQATTNSSDVVFGLSLDAHLVEYGSPAVVGQPQAQCVPLKSNVRFKVAAAGAPPLLYQWKKDGLDLADSSRIRGTTSPELSITDAGTEDLGGYSVAVQNAEGMVISERASLFFPSPPFRWAGSAGGAGVEDSHDIAVDRWGNVYVTGSFSGACSWGNTNVTAKGGTDAYLAAYDRHGILRWIHTAGGSGKDYGAGVALDAAGNCYLAGHFSGTATFGSSVVSSAGDSDAFVARYSSSGVLMWVRRGGGSLADQCWSIAVDDSGASFITGQFNGTASFGSQVIGSTGGSDMYVARCETNGNFTWVVRGGGSNVDYGAHVATDAEGNAHVTGWFTGPANFSGRALNSAGASDAFVAEYRRDGVLLWVQTAGDTRTDVGKSIATDTDGNSYVLGIFDAVEAKQPPRLQIWKYNRSGVLQWQREALGGFYTPHCTIAADNRGCYLAGAFHATATFGQATLVSMGGLDVFVAGYDSHGALQWAKQAGGTDEDAAAGISVSPNGDVFLTGWFGGTTVIGTNVLTSKGSNDFFIARLGQPFSPSSLRLDQASMLADNRQFKLRMQGLGGADNAALHVSTNLVTWDVTRNIPMPQDSLELLLPIPTNGWMQFFRLVVSPE